MSHIACHSVPRQRHGMAPWLMDVANQPANSLAYQHRSITSTIAASAAAAARGARINIPLQWSLKETRLNATPAGCSAFHLRGRRSSSDSTCFDLLSIWLETSCTTSGSSCTLVSNGCGQIQPNSFAQSTAWWRYQSSSIDFISRSSVMRQTCATSNSLLRRIMSTIVSFLSTLRLMVYH